jgi:hypothetical protein
MPAATTASAPKIPRRVLTALMSSVAAGVTPRAGIEHLAVGRKEEIGALVTDLDGIGEGGAAFRIVSGPFGSGKSFLLHLIRNYALERDYVVMDADLSPERRLTGTQGQGLATFRELTKNTATRTRPDGGALATLLEKWIAGVQADVMRDQGLTATDPGFPKAVEAKITETIKGMEGLVHGFDFAQVISTYWQGHIEHQDEKKAAALRWLRGEFATKTEAREALGGTVRVMIDDDSWYDYLKVLATFVTAVGYKGLVVLIDEAVNLYKISHTHARTANYEKLLSILNDCLQGRAGHLAIMLGATPHMVEDTRRGLFSYEALRTRLQESRFAAAARLRDVSGTVIKLEPLSFEEVFVLLQRLRHLHALFHKYPEAVTDGQLKAFMEETLSRVGADRFATPREIIRDLVAVLNLIQQNPDLQFDTLIHGNEFQPTPAATEPDESVEPEPTPASLSPGDVHDASGKGLVDPQFKEFKL